MTKRIALACLAAACLALPAASLAYPEDSRPLLLTDPPWLRLGGGVTYSPDLEDMMDDYGLDESGDWGWIDVNAGLEWPLSESLYFNPYVAFYFNQLSGDEDGFNAMIVPALALRLVTGRIDSLTDYWYPEAIYDTFLQVEVNYGIPFDGTDEIDMDPAGFGFAGLVGLQLHYGYDLAVGYSYIPVEDDFEDDRNVGGFLVRLNRSF